MHEITIFQWILHTKRLYTIAFGIYVWIWNMDFVHIYRATSCEWRILLIALVTFTCYYHIRSPSKTTCILVKLCCTSNSVTCENSHSTALKFRFFIFTRRMRHLIIFFVHSKLCWLRIGPTKHLPDPDPWECAECVHCIWNFKIVFISLECIRMKNIRPEKKTLEQWANAATEKKVSKNTKNRIWYCWQIFMLFSLNRLRKKWFRWMEFFR